MENGRTKIKGRQVLLINDLAGYGKVALSVMIPVLSHMGHHIYNLPTALVSNTLDYGKFDILETTDYIRNTICVWKELGFHFDAVSTGFIVSDVQAKMIADFCREQRKAGMVIFVDPIMGDDGKLYNGITEQTIAHMKELVRVSDYMVLNYTEAAYLAGMKYNPEGQTLLDSTKNAMDTVSTLIDRNKDNKDKFKGIPLETCLEVLEA